MPGDRPDGTYWEADPHPEWEEKFWEAYKKTHLINEACKVAGISRTYFYHFRKRAPEFNQKFMDEVENSTEILEQIAIKRAAEGSDTLMMFLLKSRRPEVYRENVHHEHDHQHQVTGTITHLIGDTQPIQIEAAKRREAARMLLAGDGEDVIEGEATDMESDEAA